MNIDGKNEEDRIREAIKDKTWHEQMTTDSWAVFKIMSELVDGFETLSRIGPCVSIFGSARDSMDTPYYKLAEEIAYLLTKKGLISSVVRAIFRKFSSFTWFLPSSRTNKYAFKTDGITSITVTLSAAASSNCL